MRSSPFLSFVALIIAASAAEAERALAASVQWMSLTDGLWQTPTNWSSDPMLPGAADDVMISQPTALKVTLSSGSQSIRQLSAQESLEINGAAELLVGSGGGSIEGNLTISNGRIVSQAGGALVVNGSVNADVAGLRALSGGTLNLPTLTAINAPSHLPATYDAQGANSKLDLSTVTTFTGGVSTSPTRLSAINGGRVELDNVSAITAGATLVLADGVTSVVDLSALTDLASNNQFLPARLDALNGGTVLTPNLATIGRTTVEVRGAASSLNLQALTNADGASFTARAGGHIAPPLLTNYAAGLGATEFFANGAGSLIDFSEVTTFSGATFNSMVISANDNAVIDLSGVTSISSGAVNLVAGAGGLVDLSSLESYTATNFQQVRRIRAENGGTVRLRSDGTTTIANAAVELVGNSTITGQELILATGATLSINGTLSADLTNVAGAVAVGGTPGTTTIAGDFRQDSGGLTQVQVGGPASGTQFDLLNIHGAAQLGGTIHVSLLGGFLPGAGQAFKVLTAAEGISGEFKVSWTGPIPWNAVYDGSSVTLVPGFDADFNGDLTVDSDDLGIWKTGFGIAAGAEHDDGDADRDGDVDGADFIQWQREVGLTLPVSIAIPEPSTLALLAVGIISTRRLNRRSEPDWHSATKRRRGGAPVSTARSHQP